MSSDVPINPIQAIVNEMGRKMQEQRSGSQMTLGSLIEALERLPTDTLVEGLRGPHSYRGYYCDLAFRPEAERRRAGDMLSMCRGAMGQVFEGYKGGDFTMGRDTPVWAAEYGSCGQKIMAVRDDGTLELADDE